MRRALSLIVAVNVALAGGCTTMPASESPGDGDYPEGRVLKVSAGGALFGCALGIMFGIPGCAVGAAMGATLGVIGGVQNELRKTDSSSASASPPSSARPTPK